MELKTGYKQTEVGVIPSDWEVKTLQSLSEKIMVGIASSATHAYRENGIVMFRNQNIKPNLLDDTDILYIAPEYEAIFKNKRLKAGDLLTARTGYPGTTCLVPVNYEGAQSFTTLISRVRDNLVNSKYLCFYLNSEKGQLFFEQNQIGGGQKNVNAGTLKLMPIPLPPTLAEQTAIATALSDTDQYITHLEKLIAKKRSIKQGAMQELLKPKEGWVVKKIFQLADCKKELFDDGDWIEAEHITDEGIRLIQTGNIGVGSYVEKDTRKYIFKQSFEKLGCKELQIGDLLICRLAEPAGRACVLPNIGEEKVITSVDVTIFRPRAEVANRIFLSYIFSTDLWLKAVSEMCGGTTHKRISRSALGKIEISVPNILEQNRIATILGDMDGEINTLQTKRSKAQSIKHGMMQQLLTGKIRLV